MRQVKLLPNSKRLTDLITTYGNIWNVIHKKEMPCFENNIGVLIESLDESYRSNMLLVDIQWLEISNYNL